MMIQTKQSIGILEYEYPEKVTSEILSLPMYPGLTEAQQKRVAECLKK